MGRPQLAILDGVLVGSSAPVILPGESLVSSAVVPLCVICRVWGRACCKLHRPEPQPKRKER